MDKKKRYSAVVLFFIIIFQVFTNFAVANEFQAVQISTNSGQNVSLTFDVEGGTDIEDVLDILNAYQVKATFLLLGTWVERYPRLSRRIVIEGHEIGNHSFSHSNLTRLSKEQIIKDIQKAETIIFNATGASSRPLLRPPYGATNASVLQAVGEAGYRYLCLWNIDPRDWDGKSAKAITNLVLNNLRPGAILLFHINRTNTPEALPNILDGIIQKGYRVVPLNQELDDNQKIITQTSVSKVVELSKIGRRASRQPSIDVMEANLAVNGKVMTMMNGPRIMSNRIFVPIRELARILDGEVFWNSAARQAILSVGNQSFQFFINGDTLINDEKIVGVPSAVLKNDISMVPLFVISRHLGLPVNWESKTRTANLIIEAYDSQNNV